MAYNALRSEKKNATEVMLKCMDNTHREEKTMLGRLPFEPGGQYVLKGVLFMVISRPEHGFIFVKNLVTDAKSSLQTSDV
jgi:hypothetical protein